MDDIQSWSEVPSIAHFCSLFRAAFNLLDFDIEELEEALLTDGAEDSGSSLLQELIVRLLCGCIQSNDVSTFNYQMFLRRLFRQKCHEYGRENPFNTDIDFQFLPLRTKVEILHALCDFRLDADDVQDLLKNLESDSLRVEPLGHDEKKSAYWYFYGTRLYREDFPRNKKIREKRRKSKEDKRKKKKVKTSYESDIEDDLAPGIWQVVCYTEEDWEKLAQKFKGSTCKDEKDLHKTLTEDFLPEIPRLFAEKERLQRKRMLEFQPRRQSSRLEKLKQREEEEKILAREEEEKLKLEKEERERRERLMARAVRAFHRGSPKSGSDCGSCRSERDRDVEAPPHKMDDNNQLSSIGRQTNNSLASATGQIIIQPPRRKKLRSKQVFKTSAEDLRTGMYKILDYIKNHDEAWPFVDPVDENYAPRYYSVIRKPMDLQRMEEKLDSGDYVTFNDFRNDFQLIVDNCRQYNGSENEYTEMVQNLQEAFQEATDRYLESDPSSDEEVAVEFPPVFEDQKGRSEPIKKKKKLKRKAKDQIKDKENKKKKYDSEDSDSKPPSLKPQAIRSPLSERSGSVPGSDFDDREPDFLREHSPPRLVKATEMDTNEESSNDSRSRFSKLKANKPKKGTGVIKNVAAIEALSLATEQTLKDINKWLDDTPRSFSEFSFASNSPSNVPSEDEFSAAGNRIETECNKKSKTDKQFRTKDKDGVKKRKSNDGNKPVKRKEVQRTIERLQPGKSKGNLITNVPKAKENVEESGLSMGLSLGKINKESRNALLVKTDETAPKLSLGTVLKSDIIGFGKNKHNFGESEIAKGPAIEDGQRESEKGKFETKAKDTNYLDNITTKSPEVKSEILKDEYSKDKENDYNTEKVKEEDSKVEVSEERKRSAVKEITNKAKPTPNLSAWFKAFGAPKTVSTVKKKAEGNDLFSTSGRSCLSPFQEAKTESLVKSGSDTKEENDKTWYNDNYRNSPNSTASGYLNKDKIEAPSSVEFDEPKSVSVASPMPSPDLRPGSASSLGQPLSNLPPAPRQRKASTSSSMSERSSFSQDPLDGSSPHLSMDERLGGYPAPYPSPLHRSPIAASPIMASPKAEDINKANYPSINGTIRVGFYQDTSSNFQKSSPEKQSPNSNSPRDQSNSSPFQNYQSHVYPPSATQNTNITKVYSQSHSTANPHSTYPDPMYRNTKPRETYDFSPKPAPYVNPEVTAKPPSSVFPVKKRVYAEIESGRLQILNETTKFPETQRPVVQPPPQCDASGNRNLYPDPRDNSGSMAYSRLQPEMQLPQTSPQYERFGQQKFPQNEIPKLVPEQPLSISQPSPECLSALQKSKYRIPSPDNTRNLGNIMDNLSRLQQQTMGVGNSVSSANRTSFSNSMESAGLGRLLQPPATKNTITEDNDGVFRNKYPPGMESMGKMPQQQSYQQEEEKRMIGPASVNLSRVQSNVNSSEVRTPSTMSYQTPMDASLRQNMSSISHLVDRYQVEERLMQQSAFYSDKGLVNIYGKNVPNCGPMYSQPGLTKVANPAVTVHSQIPYSREQELNIPKPATFPESKKSRKKQTKNSEPVPPGGTCSGNGNTAFQQYVNIKSNEPPAISLKTASVVPGSAFNFGPAPTSLGLTNPLYSEKETYGGFLEDFRSQPSSYYSMVAAATHRSTPEAAGEKPSNPPGSSNAFPFLGHPQTRTSGYPPLPQFVNSHQPPLVDPATASSPLYQQYIQRLQEEQLRHTGVLHQGLLGPSSGYAPGYHHPALGIPRQPYDRPSWL
ncbi:hypothetical protein RUM44_010262 [Polyplax serrata]|uniref:Bromo domain-containing protein n=1 Tax=Polyplax serrata TaxID=468196 RepID=A0ABR1AVC1_POLSC